MRVEYETIAKAGFVLQVDDAWLAALWDRIGIQMGLAAYKRFCMVRVEALNHALRNIPPEQVRYHLCWGSWHGPHAYDIPLPDIVDVLLAVNAQTYLFEAGMSGMNMSTRCGKPCVCRKARSSRPASSAMPRH